MVRVMRRGSRDEGPGGLDLIGNDVSLFSVQPDGVIQQRMPGDAGQAHPISAGGRPRSLRPGNGGAFMWHAREVEGYARRERSETFGACYRRATVFWSALSSCEKERLVVGFRCEVGNARSVEARRRAIAQLHRIDGELARRVAEGLETPAAVLDA